MQNLVDGDFASNNGGWQWSSSTGTDSQPYFRVFNPLLQSEKFDSNGKYIRRWVPELAQVSTAHIHNPSVHLSSIQLEKIGYSKPIVDHAKARIAALTVFKKAFQKDQSE